MFRFTGINPVEDDVFEFLMACLALTYAKKSD